MNLKSKDYACPSCGATLKYSPERQKLFCDNCQTSVNIEKQTIIEKYKWEDLKKYNIETIDKEENLKVLKCLSCGASVKLNRFEYSNKCEYCGNNIVGIFADKSKLTPNAIIPFKYGLQEAGKMMAKGVVNSRMFVPTEIRKGFPVDKIKGLYFPSFSYDAHSESDYDGVLAYTETYYSHGERKTRTVYKDIFGHHGMDLNDVVVSYEYYRLMKEKGIVLNNVDYKESESKDNIFVNDYRNKIIKFLTDSLELDK